MFKKDGECNENVIQSLERMLATIGGGWFELMMIDLFKLFAKKVYTCPKCDHEIEKDVEACPNCGEVLTWDV